jgi:hypothetical protein
MHSVHNLDLLVGAGFDVAIVSAPMASTQFRPTRWQADVLGLAVRAELDREVQAVESSGTTTAVFGPTVADRRVMGPNLFDRSRRARTADHVYRELGAMLHSSSR